MWARAVIVWVCVCLCVGAAGRGLEASREFSFMMETYPLEGRYIADAYYIVLNV